MILTVGIHIAVVDFRLMLQREPGRILDKKTGHLIHNDAEFDQLTDTLDKEFDKLPIYRRYYQKFQFWWNG